MSQLLYMGQSSNLTTPCSNTSLIPVFSENALNAKYWYSSQIEGVNLTFILKIRLQSRSSSDIIMGMRRKRHNVYGHSIVLM